MASVAIQNQYDVATLVADSERLIDPNAKTCNARSFVSAPSCETCRAGVCDLHSRRRRKFQRNANETSCVFPRIGDQLLRRQCEGYDAGTCVQRF